MVPGILYLRCKIDHDDYSIETRGKKHFTLVKKAVYNSIIKLVFDSETSVDQSQKLLFGSCRLVVGTQIRRSYLYYRHNLKEEYVQILKDYGKKFGFDVLSRCRFVEDVFIPQVYKNRAVCIGFNLPFDLTTLSIRQASSRKYKDGFSVVLSERKGFPRIVIKNLNSKAAFIEFTKPSKTKNSEKKRGGQSHYKGCFVDLKTATFALTNESYTLEEAGKALDCKKVKECPIAHGKINEEYIGYNVNDTDLTYELYTKVMERFHLYCLDHEKYLNELYSPASLGKAYLAKIGILSFLEKNPNFSNEELGIIMSTYYGGLVCLYYRGYPILVSYIDFTSMYPSLYSLLGMDTFLKAERIISKNATPETQSLLNSIKLEDVGNKSLWPRLTTICKLKPNNDLLVARSEFGSKNTLNIAMVYLKSKDGVSCWYTLADLVASKIRTGKTPVIEEARTFIPEGVQKNLKEICLLDGISVKPEENFIKKLIGERLRIKKKSKELTGQARENALLQQEILKIIANSTSYGIYIEIDPMDVSNSQTKHKNDHKKKNKDEATNKRSENEEKEQSLLATVYGLKTFSTKVKRIEKEGKAYNPIIATFITAGARLILATAEKIVKDNGGYLAYCDTDSIFISPGQVKKVQEFFKSLNPYAEETEMFKIEDYSDEDKKKYPLDNVWFYGISSKRYVLYTRDEITGEIKIKKYSSHGLWHLQGLDEKQWWLDILTLHYNPEKRKEVMAKYEGRYATQQLTISKHEIWNRFKEYNKGKPYEEQIKPHNFITIGVAYRKDRETEEPIIPMLPYISPKKKDANGNNKPNPAFREIPHRPFINYRTGKLYEKDTEMYWRPLTEYFEEFRNNPESKMDGDTGWLHRKHMIIDKSSIRHVGKETNELEESELVGADFDNYTRYEDNGNKDITNTQNVILTISEKQAVALELSRRNWFYLKKKAETENNDEPIRINKKTMDKLKKPRYK